MEIVFDLPTSSTPGYLKRQRAAVALQGELVANPTAETVDKLVEFLLQFVKEPQDRDEARGLLWDMPQTQFDDVLKRVTESATPPKSSGQPATGPAGIAA